MIPHAAEQPSPPATTTEPAPQSPCSAVGEETATTAPAPQPEGSPYLPAAHREKQQRPNIVRNKQMRKFEVTLAYLCDSQHLKFSSVTQSCPTLCNPMDCSTPGLPVHHQLPGPTQTHVHHISNAIQSSHPLSSPSPPTFSLSQHQGLFQRVGSLHQVAKVLEFQFQHQSFQ